MTNPIQSSVNRSDYAQPEATSAAENEAQMSLISAHPGTSPSQGSAPAAAAPATPAVSALVSRFSPPSGVHPPVEPSLSKALLNCSLEASNLALQAAVVIAAAPETLGASLIGAARLTLPALVVQRCVERDEAAQVAVGTRANQAADCASQGAIALSLVDGGVICEK